MLPHGGGQRSGRAGAYSGAECCSSRLSIEAIGSGVGSDGALNNLAAIAFPDPVTILAVNETNIPNPLNGSFVVPVSDFDSLAPVLLAKVIASVTPDDPNPVPVPGTLLLVLFGALITALRASKKSSGVVVRNVACAA